VIYIIKIYTFTLKPALSDTHIGESWWSLSKGVT